jgi:hypothetical protein
MISYYKRRIKISNSQVFYELIRNKTVGRQKNINRNFSYLYSFPQKKETMHTLKLLFIFLVISLLTACGGETSSGTVAGEDQNSSDTTSMTESDLRTTDLPVSHDCTITNDVLEGNQLWVRDANTLIAITADSTTLDEDFGASHRVLEIYNTETCEQIGREVLPVNVSPDFPYFIAEITYNNESDLVGIRGARTIYIYDIANHRLLPPLEPQYLSKRLSEDAQSGNILRLEVWENYLIGFAEDEGTFAFDLDNAETPKAILPIAEFKTAETEYIPLFAFSSGDGMTQLTLPAYNRETDEYSINALYPAPQNINTTLAANVRNNRYIVLRKNDGNKLAIAIDMLNRKLLDVPAEVATQSAQQVLQWARGQ